MTSATAVAIVVLACGLVYWLLLPRAIPGGIPFNEASKRSILGDIPKVTRYVKKHRDPFKWLALQCQELNSPIVQVWIRPGQGPQVIVCDFREAQDILLRRTKEFDRSQLPADIFDNTMSYNTIRMKTDKIPSLPTSVRRYHVTGLINRVAAPHVHQAASALIRLWQVKRALAVGRPICVAEDFNLTIFDAIWGVTFGVQLGSPAILRKALLTKPNAATSNKDEPVAFHEDGLDPIYHAIGTISHSATAALSSPFPWYHHWMICHLPPVRPAIKLKDKAIKEIMASSRAKYATKIAEGDSDIQSATDCVLRQEAKAVEKGQKPFPDQFYADELLGFLIAGHETTSSVCKWAMKHLSNKQGIQTELRRRLQVSLGTTRSNPSDTVIPSVKTIMETSVPYLDAVIEEVLRIAAVASGISREAKVDTQNLGYHIPKGTEVFFPNMGPGFLAPHLGVDENQRSNTSRAKKDITGEWEVNGIYEFIPERWLVKDHSGNVTFNPNASPNLPFSAGIRGCFGQRLAYAELRLLITLIVLNFDLQPPSAELNSYDAEVKLTRDPRQCYVKLYEIK